RTAASVHALSLPDALPISAIVARELHGVAQARGVSFIDAPVSGGQAGAENGVLTVMAGGDAAAFEKASPVISSFARMVKLLGPSDRKSTRLNSSHVKNSDA